MLFRQLFDRESCTYTYLLASPTGTRALLIDPVREHIDQYMTLLQELGLILAVVIDTHVHADHVTGSGGLRQKTGCQIMMGQESKAQGVTHFFKDKETIEIDGLSLKALYTPGHTDDSYCFLMKDRVFTGDTLFIRGTGRTDFQHGDAKAAYHSLFHTLLTLPDSMLIYPGHDYQGMTVSTIEEEKKFNPRLQVDSAEAYTQLMAQLHFEKPKKIDIAVPANLCCGLIKQ